MTEAKALDEAAKAAGWLDWDDACQFPERGEIESIRAHATTLMENAALKAEIERLTAILSQLNDTDIVARMMAENERLRQAVQVQMDAKHREAAEAKLWFTKAQEWKAENERLREAMTAMHKDLLLRAEIDIRDGTKIVHASNGVWLKFCAALKEIDNGDR